MEVVVEVVEAVDLLSHVKEGWQLGRAQGQWKEYSHALLAATLNIFPNYL